MMSLLVVDDEVIIADGICQMVQEAFDGRLAVYHAYSAVEAQRIIRETPVDILLTDIDMPGISGLELNAWVIGRWPLCKVLFLTGYSDFAYARQALEQHAFAYLLKSDTDQKIIDALERAIGEITRQEAQLLADPRLQKARPVYIKECINQFLYSSDISAAQLPQLLSGWDLRISFDKPVFFAIGVLSGVDYRISDAISAVESLAEGRMHHLVTEINLCTIAIIAQTYPEPDLRLFSGILETAQRMLRTEKHAYLTILYCTCEEAWERLPAAYRRLTHAMELICPTPGEHIAVDSHDGVPEGKPQSRISGWTDVIKQVRVCDDYLATGQEELYYWETQKIWNQIANQPDPERAAMVYHTLLMMIDASMQNFPDMWDEYQNIKSRYSAAGRGRYDWVQMRKETDELAGCVFRAQQKKTVSRREALVQEVNGFIQNHLSEDLSLTRIASAVNFHPAYLSRIYKESTQKGLSEYIWEQRLVSACKMLKETHMRIADISKALGFTSPTYFARFFKKHKGISPQEYRDRFLSSS